MTENVMHPILFVGVKTDPMNLAPVIVKHIKEKDEAVLRAAGPIAISNACKSIVRAQDMEVGGKIGVIMSKFSEPGIAGMQYDLFLLED